MKAKEFIIESRVRPTGNDSAQAWINYFLTSEHPSLKGQDPETLKRMALAARSKAVNSAPKTKPTFKPSKPNPNTRYWWQEKDESTEVDVDERAINEKRKRKKSKRYAAWGPGPYGSYGYAVGYSGDSGAEGGDGGGGESIEQEGWKDWVAGAAMGAAALGGAGNADAAQKHTANKPSIQHVVKKQEVKPVAPPAASKKELSKSVTNNPHEVYLKKVAEKSGIKGQELIAFLSQCAHETLDFKHMKEIGGKLDFKKYDPRFAPRKAKILGNTQAGDGAKYKGRGYIQITGKYNYGEASKAIFGDDRLVKNPELVEKPEIAAKTSVWYWKNRVANKVNSFKNTQDVTKQINPGLKHLDKRMDKQKAFQVAMR